MIYQFVKNKLRYLKRSLLGAAERLDGALQPAEFDFMLDFLEEGDTAYDVGSNIGVWSYFLSLSELNLNIVACDLGLQTTDCSSTNSDIPDGVYVIRYSVSPNDKVYVEYNHLRISKILTLYFKILCDIDIQACEPTSDQKELIDRVYYLRTLIDAAVAKVEYCGSPNHGMDIYNFALKELQKISCLFSNC